MKIREMIVTAAETVVNTVQGAAIFTGIMAYMLWVLMSTQDKMIAR